MRLNKLLLILALFSAQALLAETHVLLLSGSTRSDSYNKKLIAEAAKLVGEMTHTPTAIDLRDYPMPFYDADLEAKSGMPEPAKRLRKLMIQSSVIIIASPEYNGSVSAVLKNSLDWASRSETGGSSRDAFKGKKFILLSASPSKQGGKKGLKHLHEIIEHIGGTSFAKQLNLSKAYDAFDDKGRLKDIAPLKELLLEGLA